MFIFIRYSLLFLIMLTQDSRAAFPVKIGFPVQLPLGARRCVELEFQTEADKIYQVEVSDDMVTWVNDGYAVQGTGGSKIHISLTWDMPALYFRVRNDGDPKRVIAVGIQGLPGPPGEPISDYATAAQGAKADTALQPGYTPSAIEAEAFWAALNGTSLRDRFDRPERYAQGQLIPHLTNLPELGQVWRVSTPGNIPTNTPFIDKGGFRAAENSICYLGNSILSPGRKFSLFFEFSMEPTSYPNGWHRLGMNVSFDSDVMMPESGDIYPGGVVHINWNDYGIQAINFYNNVLAYNADKDKNILQIGYHQFRTGDGFVINSGQPPLPLILGEQYYAKVISPSEIMVAATPQDAREDRIIDLTSNIPSIQTLQAVHEPFHPINRPSVGILHWHPEKKPLIADKRYVMYVKVDGEVLEVGIAGVGSILFENSQLPAHVGEETTNFWWEPSAASLGGSDQYRYKLIAKLHSVWSLPNLNTSWLSSFGGEPLPSLDSVGPYNFRGTIQSYGSDTLQMAATLPPIDIRFVAGANGTSARGDQSLAKGGHVFIEGGYLSNVGATGLGNQIVGRAPMALDNNLIDPIRSPADSDDHPLHSARLTPALEAGDSEEIEYFGNLTEAETKRIHLVTQKGGQTVFDNNADGDLLTATQGPFSIQIFRHVASDQSNTCFVKFQADGVNLIQRHKLSGLGSNPGTLDFRATNTTEGTITLEAIRHVVHRVKNN